MKSLTALALVLGLVAITACSSTVESDASTCGSGPSGSGSGGSDGSGGGAPSVACTWKVNATSGATCASGACPITLDEELRCDDDGLALSGLRVAPGPDATWLATSSANDREVYRITNGSAHLEDAPAAFANATILLAMADDGAVHLAASPTDAEAVYATNAGGAWASEQVSPPNAAQASVVDLEVGFDGAPRLWIGTDPDAGAYALATKQSDAWTFSNGEAGLSSNIEGNAPRFTIAGDGSAVPFTQPFDGDTFQLYAAVDGVTEAVGAPNNAEWGNYQVTAAPAPAAPANGLLFAVALADDVGIDLVRVDASGAREEAIAGTTAPVSSCTAPNTPNCSGTCTDTASGVKENAFAVAATDDGVVWLAYVTSTVDETWTWAPMVDAPLCIGTATGQWVSTLHLVRAPLDGVTAAKEVLTMPIGAMGDDGVAAWGNARFLDARGFGTDLAIGVRTAGDAAGDGVRVLRVDTTTLD